MIVDWTLSVDIVCRFHTICEMWRAEEKKEKKINNVCLSNKQRARCMAFVFHFEHFLFWCLGVCAWAYVCMSVLRSITYSCSSEQNDFQKYYSDSVHTNATELKKKYENEQNWIVLLTKTHCKVHRYTWRELVSVRTREAKWQTGQTNETERQWPKAENFKQSLRIYSLNILDFV